MKIPTKDGYYRYYDGETSEKMIVLFYHDLIFKCGSEEYTTLDYAETIGSRFIRPIKPIYKA